MDSAQLPPPAPESNATPASSVKSSKALLTEACALNISHSHSNTALKCGLLSVLDAAELTLTNDERTLLICDLLTEATSRLKETSSHRTEVSSSKSSSATPALSSASSSKGTTSTDQSVIVIATGLSKSDVSGLSEYFHNRGWTFRITNATK